MSAEQGRVTPSSGGERFCSHANINAMNKLMAATINVEEREERFEHGREFGIAVCPQASLHIRWGIPSAAFYTALFIQLQRLEYLIAVRHLSSPSR